jgi:hypothetical protein
MSLDYINTFFDCLAAGITPALSALEPRASTHHWLMIDDHLGPTLTTVDTDDVVIHEALQALVAGGARGAGFATYNPDLGRVVASVLVTNPTNSDIRVADVIDHDGALKLAPWQYTV